MAKPIITVSVSYLLEETPTYMPTPKGWEWRKFHHFEFDGVTLPIAFRNHGTLVEYCAKEGLPTKGLRIESIYVKPTGFYATLEMDDENELESDHNDVTRSVFEDSPIGVRKPMYHEFPSN